jgi:zinc transport system substrate-binding protein
MVSAIAREMCVLDEKNSDTYLANAKAYNESLDRLDSEIAGVLGGLSCRKFIVYHPAFGYLADDYSLEMIALEEDGKEATAQRLQEVIDLAKAEGIKSIFYQEEIDSSQSQAFAEEIGGKTVQLAPLSADYANNLLTMAKTMAGVMQ